MGPVTKGLRAMSHAGIQKFLFGGGVVQGRLLENSLNNVFFSSAYFIVYRGGQIVYQWFNGSMYIAWAS